MPRTRIGTLPMTAVQRQAPRRARLRRERLLPPARRPPPRPQRWTAAVATLIALQDEYRAGSTDCRIASKVPPRREAAGHHRARPRRTAGG
jgi:hypothetical protein